MENRKVRWIDVRELDSFGDKGEHTLSVGYLDANPNWRKRRKQMTDKVRIIMPSEVEVGKDFTARVEKVESPSPMDSWPDGTLLMAIGGYMVFIVEGGVLRHIYTQEVFDKMGAELGFTRADIVERPQEELDEIDKGKPIYNWPEGSGLDPETIVEKFLLGYLPQPNYNMRLPEAKDLGVGVIHSHKWELDFIEDQLNICQSLGLKYVVQLRDGKTMPREIDIKTPVERFKDHPALWGYNTVDDFDWREYIGKERQRILYDWVKKYDPDHPVSVTGADWKWEESFEPRGFDVLFYQTYGHRVSIKDPVAWQNYMVERLAHWDLSGKRIIPVQQSFGPRPAPPTDNPDWLTPNIKRSYEIVNKQLKIKSVGCWDWEGISRHPEFHNDIRGINNDR